MSKGRASTQEKLPKWRNDICQKHQRGCASSQWQGRPNLREMCQNTESEKGYPIFQSSFSLQECLQKDSFNHSPRQAKVCPRQPFCWHPSLLQESNIKSHHHHSQDNLQKIKSQNAFVAHQTSEEKGFSLGRPQVFQALAPSLKNPNKHKLEYPKAFHYNSECYQVVNYFSNLRADKEVAQNQHWLRELTLSNNKKLVNTETFLNVWEHCDFGATTISTKR